MTREGSIEFPDRTLWVVNVDVNVKTLVPI